jgi:hypothetical protein
MISAKEEHAHWHRGRQLGERKRMSAHTKLKGIRTQRQIILHHLVDVGKSLDWTHRESAVGVRQYENRPAKVDKFNPPAERISG